MIRDKWRRRIWRDTVLPKALAFVGVLALLTALVNLSAYSWAGWLPATCISSGCFCEAIRSGPVAQPANTYSNLAFCFVGFLILAYATRLNPQGATTRERSSALAPARNLMDSHPAYAGTYGMVLIGLGLGSLFYHASLTFAGQWFDVMGMYLLITLAALYNIARLRAFTGIQFALAYVIVNFFLAVLLIAIPEIRRDTFAALVVATILLEVWVHRARHPRIRTGYLFAALATFALAYGIRILDNTGAVCAPKSILQGHAAWHLLSAASASSLFAYYRSERLALDRY